MVNKCFFFATVHCVLFEQSKNGNCLLLNKISTIYENEYHSQSQIKAIHI